MSKTPEATAERAEEILVQSGIPIIDPDIGNLDDEILERSEAVNARLLAFIGAQLERLADEAEEQNRITVVIARGNAHTL